MSAERPQAIAQILIAIGAIEVAGLVANDGKAPGDYGFDPLGLKPKTEEAFEELQLKEIKNGRLAMVSVVRAMACRVCLGGSGWGWSWAGWGVVTPNGHADLPRDPWLTTRPYTTQNNTKFCERPGC